MAVLMGWPLFILASAHNCLQRLLVGLSHRLNSEIMKPGFNIKIRFTRQIISGILFIKLLILPLLEP